MIGFNHTLAGAITAVALKNPLLIAPVAFASHFVCDSLPHFGRVESIKPFNKRMIRLLIFDAFVCFSVLAVCLYVWPELWLALLVGMAFATLPDFLWIYYFRAGEPEHAFFKLHTWLQWGERPYGWIYEAIYFSLFLFLLTQLRAK